MQRVVSLITTACLLTAMAAMVFAPASGAQTLAPSFMGERFQDAGGRTFGADPVTGAPFGTCDPAGISTITYDKTGVATGPYPGTFTETGTFTVGPQTAVTADFVSGGSGAVLSFTASFTVNSPIGQVSGTRSLVDGTASCLKVTDELTNTTTTLVSFNARAVYEVTITTATGVFQDSGLSFVTGATQVVTGPDGTVVIGPGGPLVLDSFNVDHPTSNGVTLLIPPAPICDGDDDDDGDDGSDDCNDDGDDGDDG